MVKIRWTSLKENGDLKEEIGIISSRIDRVLDNDTERHLADVGCLLRFVAKDLESLAEKVFDRHEEKKIVKVNNKNMKTLTFRKRNLLYILLAVCAFSCKQIADKLPESNRSYVMKPKCAVGQMWIKYDTLNPFEPEIDTLEILKIERGWAWIKMNNKYEYNKECDAIERFWEHYR